MATYRPKSLNEINNSYDKTLTTKNVIKVNETALAAAAEQPSVTQEIAEEEKELLSPVSTVGDLTGDIQKFIREFSAPAKEEKPAPRTTQIRPAAVRPQTPRTPEKAPEPERKPERKPEPAAEKPEFVMTAEKSELFEEYMKIMSDEDDDVFFSKPKAKKKKKTKKYEEAPAVAEQNASDFTEASSESSAEEELPESFTAPEYESELIIPEKPSQDTFIPDDDDNDETEAAPVKERKGKLALQLVLIISLLLTLVAALGTTLLNVVLKVNTGEAFAEKYYVYTVNKDDAVLNLTKGDLVVAVDEAAAENDIVAYYNSDSKAFDFAVKRAEIGEDVIFAENGASNGPVNIFNTHVRGRLTKIYPSVGNIVGLLSANFALILAVLMAIALVLILILAFAFGKGKKNDEDTLTFYDDEAYDPVF